MKPFLIIILSITSAMLCHIGFAIDLKTVALAASVESAASASGKPTLRIESRIGEKKWRRKTALSPLKGETVGLRIPEKDYKAVRWYLIFADLTRNYKNANHPWEPEAYKWVGYAQIRYYRIELVEARGQLKIEPLSLLPDAFRALREWFRKNGTDEWRLSLYHDRIGTFLFQAEAEDERGTMRSPGITEADAKGIIKGVMRVSVREADGYLGYLSSLYNVPGVFGSVISQAAAHVGADCADILMTALSDWRHQPPSHNFNVSMLVGKLKNVAVFEMQDGSPSLPIRWGEEVRPGDFIAVRYGEGTKKYHHIGALYGDENKNAMLDGADLVLHAGPDPLHLSSFSDGAFDGHVVILRP